MAGPSFDIPARPQRRYPYSGGVEYEGETVFTLTPTEDRDEEALMGLVESIVTDAYTYGDWFDLPMPLFLVHDDETGDVFRVAIRDGTVELHVLPATESEGLRRFYDRLLEESRMSWHVECRFEKP
jgi:hypothetical protein